MNISLKKCNFGFEELKALGHIVSGLSLGIDKNKVAEVLLKLIPQNKKEMMSFLGFASYYRQNLKYFAILARSLYRICDQQTVFEMTQERIKAYEKIRKALTEAPLLLMPNWNIPFKLYIDSCGDGFWEAHIRSKLLNTNLQRDQYITSQEKSNQQKPDMVQAIWSVYVITDCNAMKSLLTMRTPNRHMLRWKIAIQEYRGNITIVHKAGKIHKNADGISRWALANSADSPACVPLEAEPQIPIEGSNTTDIGTKFFEEVRQS
ncbi:hypothetical protein O181_023803 [Austropuccinia psidii MF-1]|uniref:Reverse transcriptase/retrotransposon-derived protein RNase H-like domain-containing protein n=1 Tax=Austropuccinia psidii MF-1 TaxID=1389203 RepID=A0A9Q3GXM0_9BASI|nr:hypothetical protein [Austropuccinia psidii MF-1]